MANLTALPNNENILSLVNSTVNKMVINSSNGYRLLTAIDSDIMNSNMNMIFTEDGEGSDYISHDLITLDNTKINTDLDMNGLALSGYYIITSNNFSKAYFNELDGNGDASPEWTYKNAPNVNLGNSMSYNVYFPPIYGDSGRFNGGSAGTSLKIIQSFNIAINSNTIDHAELPHGKHGNSTCSDGITAFDAGSYTIQNWIDYYLIASSSNAIDWGDLTVGRHVFGSGSDGTIAAWGGGYTTHNTIDYITIAAQANAVDFGDLTMGRAVTACYNKIYVIFAGDYHSIPSNIIDYITMAIQSNATDFGDLRIACSGMAACSDGTRGIWGGGDGYTHSVHYDHIDYLIMNIKGNTTNYGTLSTAREYAASCCNGSKAVFGGGVNQPEGGYLLDIETINTSIGETATNFGDMVLALSFHSGCSGN